MFAAPGGLTAALIVKDEAQFLAGCLLSLASLVDEVVVVDTGSTDDTIEIARSHGARVFRFRWCGRFDDARNESLRRVRTAWVLYIDADERVCDGDRERLYASLDAPDLLAARVAFVPKLGYTAYREWRLFRSHPRIRFRGGMHETLLPALAEVQYEEGGRFAEADLALEHLGYEGDLTHKHRRNLPLLRRAVEEDPERFYLWTELGRAAAALGEQGEATRAFSEAVRVAGGREGEDAAFLPYADLLAHILEHPGVAPLGEAERLADRARAAFPENPDVRFLAAQTFLTTGRIEDALDGFAWLLCVDPAAFGGSGAAFDHGIFGVHAAEGAAQCCFDLGRDGEAYGYWSLAAELAPDRLDLRMKAAIAAKRAGVIIR